MLEMGLSEITILILLEYLAVDRKSVFIVISLGEEMWVQSLGCCPESDLFEMKVVLIGDDSV